MVQVWFGSILFFIDSLNVVKQFLREHERIFYTKWLQSDRNILVEYRSYISVSVSVAGKPSESSSNKEFFIVTLHLLAVSST